MDSRLKKIALLGSTGSIGRQTLEVIRAFPDEFKVVGLSAGNNVDLLTEQVREFQPSFVHARSPIDFHNVITPEDMARHEEVDFVVVATSGRNGLVPTLAALESGKVVALANKEALVMAGEVMLKARKYDRQIIPVDSEHSAIWQCLEAEQNPISRVLLTASGGPFLSLSAQELSSVTPAQALRHPTWKMGKKVTMDSATLMNKGFEAIEAHWLFSVSLDKIEIVIHPQSVVHSMVEFEDGILKAQLSQPDMRFAIQYALSYPHRLANKNLPTLDLSRIGTLAFEAVDYDRFPCIRLAFNAARAGGTYPAVLCAADEVAVELFLSGQIRFPDIPRIIEETLSSHTCVNEPSLEDILATDLWASNQARSGYRKVGTC